MHTPAHVNPSDDIWVFGYGSLMWNPGFDYLDVKLARIYGVHRAPCIYSWVHRGTRERPGIVMGLAQGGACIGKAFKIAGHAAEETINYLRRRELVTNVYLERIRPIHLETGEKVSAVTYIADTQHEQYAGHLSHDQLVRQISGAVGQSGDNESYIIDTANHLRELSIRDRLMERVADDLKNLETKKPKRT